MYIFYKSLQLLYICTRALKENVQCFHNFYRLNEIKNPVAVNRILFNQ
jgi:hypothetical protein